MRKPLRRAEIQALTTLLYDDNTEGPLDGLEWTKYPGLFVRRTGNTASWVFRWNVAGGKKKVMGLGSREKVAPQEAVDLAERYMEIARSGGDPTLVRPTGHADTDQNTPPGVCWATRPRTRELPLPGVVARTRPVSADTGRVCGS